MATNNETDEEEGKLPVYIFFAMWLWIGVVSCLDTALTIKYRESLRQMEENPIATYLIFQMDDGSLCNFVGIKMFGTILVLGTLVNIFNLNMKWGFTIVAAVAAFQTGLLAYLLFL